MDEVSLTAAEADLANAIRAVDAQLDELAERERRTLGFGMRAGGAGGWFAHQAEDELDARRATLLQRRAELAAQLRHQVEGD
ncbi:hypothetical protein [Amnibacterium kyonggiense]|uniref:hypothetical protein n=1 Tax=Amnibacterium kyonggiense TaxID=595671 RepID=UPI001060507D|nr:hypothetical protein [Amnibacterium kyonggiense]